MSPIVCDQGFKYYFSNKLVVKCNDGVCTRVSNIATSGYLELEWHTKEPHFVLEWASKIKVDALPRFLSCWPDRVDWLRFTS